MRRFFKWVGIRASTAILSLYLFFTIATITYIYSVQSCVVQKPETTAYNLTDKNWINGIGINSTGFFVSNSRANLDYYQTGKLVKFSDGEARQIVRTEKSGPYLNIYVSGNPLDGNQVGFPNPIEAVK